MMNVVVVVNYGEIRYIRLFAKNTTVLESHVWRSLTHFMADKRPIASPIYTLSMGVNHLVRAGTNTP